MGDKHPMAFVKNALRHGIVSFSTCLARTRVFLGSAKGIPKDICFANVNNYPYLYFSRIMKAYDKESYPLYQLHDTWDALITSPLGLLKAVASAQVVAASGESPVFNIMASNQQLVYFWHACGAFKRMRVTGGHRARKPDWIIVSSEGVRPFYAEAFNLPIERIVALGVPRTEIFQDAKYIEEVRQNFLARYPQLAGRKVYLHAPTYRESPFRSEAGFDTQKLSSLLNKDEVLIYKQHPAVIREGKLGRKVSSFRPADNIICMDSEDILQLTIICDVIMTDYSSSIFEAILLDKPCVFCASDIDRYEKGFYLNYRKDLPGQIIESGRAEDVVSALRQASIKHPNYILFKEFHLGACTGPITQRAVDFLKKISRSK